VHEEVPGLLDYRQICVLIQDAVVQAPRKSIEKEGSAAALRPGVVGSAKVRVPVAARLLARGQRLRHGSEGAEVFSIVRIRCRKYGEYFRMGRKNPTVAARPVSGGVYVGAILPPEPGRRVIEPYRVLRVTVERVHGGVIVGVVVDGTEFSEVGHGHVDRVDPGPLVVDAAVDHSIDAFRNAGQIGGVVT